MIARRGERKPVALTVEVAVGLPQILRTMRNKPEVAVAAAPGTAASGRRLTIMGYGGLPESGDGIYGRREHDHPGVDPGVVAAHPPLTMVDHSDSGCRLHGPTLGTNPIMPGRLIAFRENAAAPWTLAVVRRVKKRLAGKRVEIGVEYLGRDPRWVVVVVPDAEASPTTVRQRHPRVSPRSIFRRVQPSGAADEDAGPAGARAGTRRSPFRALAHVRAHDPAEGAARRASRIHLVAVRDPRALAKDEPASAKRCPGRGSRRPERGARPAARATLRQCNPQAPAIPTPTSYMFG